MKKILLSMSIISLFATVALAQGFVYFATGAAAANRISTNSILYGPATGLTGNTPGIYCYALYASRVNASINGSTNAIAGNSPNYVFDNPTGWTLVGMGQNTALPGRMAATTQGTTSANQGPLNADNSLTVQGIGGWQAAYFVVLGWSAPSVGTTVEALALAYHTGASGWVGQSAVSGPITLGDGATIPAPNVFSQGVRGFVLGVTKDDLLDGPVIYMQPVNLRVGLGSNATLFVGARARGWTVSYAWHKDSSSLVIGTNATYQIINATTNDAGQYYVVVYGSNGISLTSTTATVTILIPPFITQQPVSQTVAAGTAVALSVTASGTGPLSYQWYGSGGKILGATNNLLTFNPAQTYNWDTYFVGVSNAFGTATSQPATLVIYEPVAILSQPVSQVVAYHGTATFAVMASGFPAPIYQWFLNGTNLVGATNSSLLISPVQLRDLGYYSVLVDNDFSFTNSFDAGLYISPSITRPFVGVVGFWGQPTTLSVGAQGSGPMNYQWFLNGVAVAGATNANYLIPTLQFTNGGLYSVIVSSAYGSATNTPCQLVVNPAGVIFAMRPSLTISGSSGYNYTIQGSFDLSNPNAWMTLTNVTLSEPIEIWHDDGTNPIDPVNPIRFYRVLPGQ